MKSIRTLLFTLLPLAYSAGEISAQAPPDASYIVVTPHAGLSAERVLAGTSNQVLLSDSGPEGTLTLSLPQSIHAAASPTFSGLTLDRGLVSTLDAWLWKFSGSLYSTGSGDRAGLFLDTKWAGGNTSAYHGLLSQAGSLVDATWIQALTSYVTLRDPVHITNLVSLGVAGHAPAVGAQVDKLYGIYVALGYVGDLGQVETVYGGYFETPAMPATTKFALVGDGPQWFKGRTGLASGMPTTGVAVNLHEEFSEPYTTNSLRIKSGNTGSGGSTALYVYERGLGPGSIQAVWARARQEAAVSSVSVTGVKASAEIFAGSTLEAFSFFGQAPSGDGAVTYAYTAYLQRPTVGTSSNWSLYAEGNVALAALAGSTVTIGSKTISEGPPDSGGAGYRVLRVPN